MKRVFCFFVLSLLAFQGQAQINGDEADARIMSVYMDSPAKLDIGDTFDISIKIRGAKQVAGFSTDVEYNPEVLRFISVENGNFIYPSYWMNPNRERGIITNILAVQASSGGASGTGTLFTIRFRADDPGLSEIKLLNFKLYNASAQEIKVTPKNATIKVLAPWDVNSDGRVDIIDFLIVGQNIGKPVKPGIVPNPDVTRDGIVNLYDLIYLCRYYGEVYWESDNLAPSKIPTSSEATALLISLRSQIMQQYSEDGREAVRIINKIVESDSSIGRISTWGGIKCSAH